MSETFSKTKLRNMAIKAEHEAELERGYDPAKPWSEYALDQAEWRISIGNGTQADHDAVATQRPKQA